MTTALTTLTKPVKQPRQTPREIARQAGLQVDGDVVGWNEVVDAAVELYWRNRPEERS